MHMFRYKTAKDLLSILFLCMNDTLHGKLSPSTKVFFVLVFFFGEKY